MKPQIIKEIQLKAIVLLSEEGLVAGNDLGYTDFEIYCLLNAALDAYLEEDDIESVDKISCFLNITPVMLDIEQNFVKYSDTWCTTKKIF